VDAWSGLEILTVAGAAVGPWGAIQKRAGGAGNPRGPMILE
jgi:hypothetical protein